MNAILQAERHIPASRKIMDYLGMMILVPIAIILVFATDAAQQSPALLHRIVTILPIAGLERIFLRLIPVFSLVATFAILYRI